jgi:hypothetical protein
MHSGAREGTREGRTDARTESLSVLFLLRRRQHKGSGSAKAIQLGREIR